VVFKYGRSRLLDEKGIRASKCKDNNAKCERMQVPETERPGLKEGRKDGQSFSRTATENKGMSWEEQQKPEAEKRRSVNERGRRSKRERYRVTETGRSAECVIRMQRGKKSKAGRKGLRGRRRDTVLGERVNRYGTLPASTSSAFRYEGPKQKGWGW